jgi:hypothetical protein
MELSIAKFDPQKAEVLALVENVKNSVISLPAGNTGYALMRENKSLLQKKRNDLVRLFKDERAGAVAYQKNIIKIKDYLLSIIQPVEMDLDAKISKIDEENARAKRVKDLPERMERLKLIEIEANPDELLGMNDGEFIEFFNNNKMEYLKKKEQAIKEAEEKKAFELAEAETKRQAEADKIEADRLLAIKVEEDAHQAKIKAENDKLEADRAVIKAEQDKIEAAKQKLIDDAAEVEREKQRQIELEAAKKKATEDEKIRIENDRLAKEALEKAEKAKFEAQEKYQQFLRDNQYTPDDIIKTEGDKTTLYRKVAEIII